MSTTQETLSSLKVLRPKYEGMRVEFGLGKWQKDQQAWSPYSVPGAERVFACAITVGPPPNSRREFSFLAPRLREEPDPG